MIESGVRLRVESETYVIDELLGGGGYGEVWKAERLRDRCCCAIKRLHKADENDLLRLEALKELQLTDRLAGAAAISDVIRPQGRRQWAGCVMPMADGIGLDEWLQRDELNIPHNILLSIQLAKNLADAHALGIAHGDVHPRNVKVCLRNETPVLSLIDWDNAYLPGLPPPRSPGAKPFLAPESMAALFANRYRPPDMVTERCSAAKVLHWLLFGRASYHTEDEDQFVQQSINGSWNSDPADGPIDASAMGGIPNTWISAQLADLFRRGLGKDRDARPALHEWLGALLEIFHQGIPVCPECCGPVLAAACTACPYCHKHFAALAAVTSGGRRITAAGQSVLIGRSQLASAKASQRHAALTRLGPETFVTDLGSKNGTFHLVDGRWRRLPSGQRYPLQIGDRLRCGDVELAIEAA